MTNPTPTEAIADIVADTARDILADAGGRTPADIDQAVSALRQTMRALLARTAVAR